MKTVRIYLACLIFFILTFTLYPSFALASEYFYTSYNVTYTVSENGNTNVKMNITLKNKSDQFFAPSYKIHVGFDEISNVTASDPAGPMVPIVKKTENGNTISVDFNTHMIGMGKSLAYTISFDTLNIAKKHGSIWEINIPGLEDQTDFDEFSVKVNVPKSFGEPVYIKPSQPNNSLVFSKEQLGKSGISIAYGREQVYSYNLFYHLRNKNVFPIRTEIALPPSTNYQESFIEYISPKPLNVIHDSDGNWLAQYQLLPSQNLTVQVKGKAVVSLFPKKQPLTEAQKRIYLQQQPYWETKRPEIIKLARELKTPKAIYDYVVKTLQYDFSRVEKNQNRLGAYATLKNPKSAVCLEFTDLFISLARAAGIPAREVDGFAYTENARERPLSLVKDILHAWPEYYDEQLQAWVMVDPTWGNTTGGVDYFDVLDFDHLAFVIRGVDSSYPIPAGGYKFEGDENLKDVNISFPNGFNKPLPKARVSMLPQQKFFSLLPIKVTVRIHNDGSSVIPAQKISVNSKRLSPTTQTFQTNEILPFGYTDINIHFNGLPFLTNEVVDFTIAVAGTQIIKSFPVVPIFFSAYIMIGGISLVILTLIIFLIARKRRSLPVSR